MLAYRLGGMPPSIDTPEALKATLLGATSISYSDPVNGGASTVYFLGVADRLGIGDAVRKKGIPTKAGEGTKPVGDGQAALGVALSSEMASSVKVVGIPLMPADPKSTIPFGAAVSSTSTAGDAATALVRFLASKDASDILDAEGFTRH
jgi:molybdate transport system substrate-binding protein